MHDHKCFISQQCKPHNGSMPVSAQGETWWRLITPTLHYNSVTFPDFPLISLWYQSKALLWKLCSISYFCLAFQKHVSVIQIVFSSFCVCALGPDISLVQHECAISTNGLPYQPRFGIVILKLKTLILLSRSSQIEISKFFDSINNFKHSLSIWLID